MATTIRWWYRVSTTYAVVVESHIFTKNVLNTKGIGWHSWKVELRLGCALTGRLGPFKLPSDGLSCTVISAGRDNYAQLVSIDLITRWDSGTVVSILRKTKANRVLYEIKCQSHAVPPSANNVSNAYTRENRKLFTDSVTRL